MTTPQNGQPGGYYPRNPEQPPAAGEPGYPPPAGASVPPGYPQQAPPPQTYPPQFGSATQPGHGGPGQVQPGYQQLPTPVMALPKVSAMPDGPREYQQMLRGPRHRWWRPLLSILLFSVFAFLLIQLVFPVLMLVGYVNGVQDVLGWTTRTLTNTQDLGPAGFFALNLSLMVLIPAAMFAVWIAHRIRPKYLSSVRGGIRWKWLGRCLLVTLPIWLVYTVLSILLDAQSGSKPEKWVTLLIIVVVMTPLQAAGEEYAFRGWLTQTVGSWFRHPMVAFAVPLVLSIAGFSAAHGSPNFWVLADLAVFAVVAAVATWRTGGLEAAIAIHAVNNVTVFFSVLIFGGWADAFVGKNTTSTPVALLISVFVNTLALVLILWQAKKAGINRMYEPRVELQTRPETPFSSRLPTQPAQT